MTRRRMLATLLMGAAILATGSCVAAGRRRGWRGAASDHFDGRRFFNPRGPTGNSFDRLIRWQRTREPRRWPKEPVLNSAIPRLPGRVAEGEAHVTLVNHCTFLIQLPGLNLLTDPVWSERVGPLGRVGPRRIRPPGIAWDALPRIDAVLVSHAHYDHLDLATLRELATRFRPKIITGLGIRALLEAQGIRDVEELDWWQASRSGVADGVTYTPAQHWSARTPFDRNTTLWGGFWLQAGRRCLYFAGDSAMSPNFAEIRSRLGVPDVALLPIGAYEPRWFMSHSHMAPEEAVRAQRDLGSPRALAMHFDTFALADEGFGDAERDLALARETAGLRAADFHAPATGETVVV